MQNYISGMRSTARYAVITQEKQLKVVMVADHSEQRFNLGVILQ